MRKRLPMSALISGLLAAPVLGTAPVIAETRAPMVLEQGALGGGAGSFPAEMPAEVGERMRRWLRGEKLNAYGMQSLQTRMTRAVQARIREVTQGQNEPQLPVATIYPVVFVTSDQMSTSLPAQKEKVTYLGVSTSAVDVVLQEQLNLGKGMGLMVDYVDTDSPADKAGVKVHDVLQKLDDQLLVNAEQLRTLVRTKKAGDTVTLTVIHGGKPAPVKVTLNDKELVASDQIPGQEPRIVISPNGMNGSVSALPQFVWGGPSGVVVQGTNSASTFSSVTLNADGSMTRKLKDQQGEITLNRDKDGKETVSVKNIDGHVIYDGDLAGAENDTHLTKDMRDKISIMHASPNPAPITAQKITMERKDGEHEIVLTVDGTGKKVLAKDLATGGVVYQGGADREEDLKRMPAGVGDKVKSMLEKLK